MRHRLPRIATIVLAYLAASIVAGTVALVGVVAFSVGPGVLAPAALAHLIPPIIVASCVAAVTAFVPTLPVGIYAERHAKRLAGWYAKAGIAVSLGALLIYVAASELASRSISNATADDFQFFLLLAACVVAAGVCSGVTYWGIAGRSAGHPGTDGLPAAVDRDQNAAQGGNAPC